MGNSLSLDSKAVPLSDLQPQTLAVEASREGRGTIIVLSSKVLIHRTHVFSYSWMFISCYQSLPSEKQLDK